MSRTTKYNFLSNHESFNQMIIIHCSRKSITLIYGKSAIIYLKIYLILYKTRGRSETRREIINICVCNNPNKCSDAKVVVMH
jgi:hypothetical protein